MDVDRLPPRVGDEPDAPLREHVRDVGVVLPGEESGSGVLEQQLTVSVASFLFVPMTPLGPRLNQPAQYRPRTVSPPASSTRPSLFGVVPVRSSNGTPVIGTPR